MRKPFSSRTSGPASPDGSEPEIRLTAQKARQGRLGKHTLIILVVSLVLAIIAGLVLGFIPTRMSSPV